MKKLICLLLVCILTALLSGCALHPKGGMVEYGVVTAMKRGIRDVYEIHDVTYYVRVESEPGSRYRLSFTSRVSASVYSSLTFGTRLKMTYTGFDNDWDIEW